MMMLLPDVWLNNRPSRIRFPVRASMRRSSFSGGWSVVSDMLASVARAAVNSGYARDKTIRARAIKHQSPFRKHLVQNGYLKNEIRRFGTLSGNSANFDETQGGTPWRGAVL